MKKNDTRQKFNTVLMQGVAKLLAVSGIAFSVFLTISMLSYNIADIPELVYPFNAIPVNFFGETGANAAFLVINYLGLSAVLMLLSIAIISTFGLTSSKPNKILLRTICSMIAVVSLSGLLAQWNYSFAATSPTAGGIIGFTTFNLLNNILGLQATRMLLVLGLTSGIFITTDLLFYRNIIEYNRKLKIQRNERLDSAEQDEKPVKIEVELRKPAISADENQVESGDESNTSLLKRCISTLFVKPAVYGFKKIFSRPKTQPDMTIPQEFIITDEDLQSAYQDDNDFHEIETYIEDTMEPSVSSVPNDTSSTHQSIIQNYELPELSMLNTSKTDNQSDQNHEVRENAALLYEALKNYGIKARIKSISMGPTVSMYEIDLAPGTKIKRLSSISSEIAMVLRAPSVRVVAPIPGKSTVGIEVPNKTKNMVIVKDMLDNAEFEKIDGELPIALGLSSVGEPMYSDLAKMPHLLIAGTTGSGKSVAANIIITSILYKYDCNDVKFVLIDPKMVEFSPFRNIPHLMFPVITEVSKAPQILSILVDEMEDRYRILERTLCKNIVEYNGLSSDERRRRITMAGGIIDDDLPDKIPYIITIIDELADLMMVAGKEIETFIVRLAQKSRAVGIHLIIATQRPSVDVITGLIKANIPCRMSFRVLSQIDSRTILDRPGAEKLLGSGDMLFLAPGSSDVLRIQNAYISNEEILRLAEFLRKQGNPNYKTMRIRAKQKFEYHKDEEFIAAAELAISCQRITAKSIVQSLGVGNKKASELISKLEDFGVIGSAQGNKAREVLMSTPVFFDALKQKAA